MIKIFAFIILILGSSVSFAQQCQIFSSSGAIAGKLSDEFYRAMVKASACPRNINTLNEILNSFLQNKKYIVANRGRNNPKLGSFSVFETYSLPNRANEAGIFLGHFTGLTSQDGQTVIDLDQNPDAGKLIIELIAWDSVKGYYNFYELIGEGSSARWFYRGDSKDILMDNRFIYLNSTPQRPPIGQTLRCSGCHISGGPIIKEMKFPHNDWWTKSRPLIFNHAPSTEFLKRLQVVDTAENFATQVQTGIHRLESSSSYQMIKKSLGIQNQLRPLFCDLEINIESDINPLEKTSQIQIPASSIASPFARDLKFSLSKGVYLGLQQKYNQKFPENRAIDADHAWLVPVKGYSDLMAIGTLKATGIVDDKTIYDIHFSAPIGSLMNQQRCQLLKLVPNSTNWKPGFLRNLKASPLSAAQAMYQRMTNASYTPAFYQDKINQWYQQTVKQLASGQSEAYFQQLLQNRAAVFTSEISKNPKGQILEPGFRVIFPQGFGVSGSRKL